MTKLNITNIKEIAIKELKSHFDHLSGYLLLAIFLSVLYFFFIRTFFLVGQASLRGMFGLLPWIFIVFIPAITMASFAKEEETQTIEYLLTKPITSLELILGKIFGSTIYVYSAILLTLPVAFLISKIGPLDSGETIAQYVGTLVLIFALV